MTRSQFATIVAFVLGGCARQTATVDAGLRRPHVAASAGVRAAVAAPDVPEAQWCTVPAVESADLHRRGAIGDRMPMVMGLLNLAGGLRLNHRADGWRVVGVRGDVCAVSLQYRNEEETKLATFGLFRRPALHLVPIDRNASDVADMFDMTVSASGSRGEQATTDDALQLARQMRDAREELGSVDDIYIDFPDGRSLVMEFAACSTDPTRRWDRTNPLSRQMRRAGIRQVICRGADGSSTSMDLATGHRR